jgi:hypothetical protein
VSFIELRAEPAVARPAQPFEVELRSGRRVRVAAGFDAAELARLVVVGTRTVDHVAAGFTLAG